MYLENRAPLDFDVIKHWYIFVVILLLWALFRAHNAYLQPFGLSLLLSLAAWYNPITMRGTLSMLCMNVYLSPVFYAVSKYMTSCATILSIVLYIPVVYLIRNQLKIMSDKLYPTQVGDLPFLILFAI